MPHEADTDITLLVKKKLEVWGKIEMQRGWGPCPNSYSFLVVEPRFHPGESDSMVLNHFLDSSSGNSHFCGMTYIILLKFPAGFNKNNFREDSNMSIIELCKVLLRISLRNNSLN